MLEPFTKEQEDELFKEINYTREKMKNDVIHLREWLKKQHHLPPSRLKEADSFLQMFLTGCKGNLDKAKKKLDGYYTFRGHSEMFNNRDPLTSDYLQAKEILYFAALPKAAKDKLVRVVAVSLIDPDAKKFDLNNFCKKIINFADIRLRLDNIYMRDFIVIDCSQSGIGHVLKLKPFLLRDMARYAQDVLPFRYLTVIFFNAPTFIDVAVNNLVKPLLSKKLKKRIMVTSGGCEELYKHIDKSSLPKEYGGDNYSLKEVNDAWHRKELEERDWYLNELSERTDESKRISRHDTLKNPFVRFPLSLKKLVID